MKTNLKALLDKRGLKLIDLARAAGVERSTVTRWHYRGIPPDRVLLVEKLTRIPRKHLRPDLYAR